MTGGEIVDLLHDRHRAGRSKRNGGKGWQSPAVRLQRRDTARRICRRCLRVHMLARRCDRRSYKQRGRNQEPTGLHRWMVADCEQRRMQGLRADADKPGSRAKSFSLLSGEDPCE